MVQPQYLLKQYMKIFLGVPMHLLKIDHKFGSKLSGTH